MDAPRTAQRTCAQCKSSKKKCDKRLPSCDRCLRLSVDCSYDSEQPAASDGGADHRDTRLDEVLRRLDRIEARIFPSEPSTSSANTHDHASKSHSAEDPRLLAWSVDRIATHVLPSTPPACRNGHEELTNRAPILHPSEIPNPHKWSVDPGQLSQEYMGFILYGNVFKILSESRTTVEAISRNYFKHTHQWLPIICPARFEKACQRFKDFDPEGGFLITILAMHLVVTPHQDHPPASSLAESPWYRACKYYFGHYLSTGKLSIDLVQAGMLIALFEYTQCIENRACLTVAMCARAAYALDLDDLVAQQTDKSPGQLTMAEEEAVHTWWGLGLLDRIFNMPPIEIPQQPTVQQKPFQISFLDLDISKSLHANSFTTLDLETLDRWIMELEAARMLAQVHALIRENRRKTDAFLKDMALPMTKSIERLVDCLRTKQHRASMFAGIAVSLSAALQLRCWFVQKQGLLDYESLIAIRSYIEQMKDRIGQCKVLHGFTENYLEQFQPSWISVAFQAVSAFRLIKSMAPQHVPLEMDLRPFIELLESVASRYKLAEYYLSLLQAT